MTGLPAVLAGLPDPAADLEALGRLAALLGHTFERPALLRAALTLPSWTNEHPGAGWPGHACLEFLGDAVLDLVTADALWRRFPDLEEGPLTRLQASLVSEASLAAAAAGRAVDALLGARIAGLRADDGVDAKSRLQTLLQARHRRGPTYAPIGERPTGQDPVWRVEVRMELPEGPQVLAEGTGRSLRIAEQAAARAALERLAADEAAVATPTAKS